MFFSLFWYVLESPVQDFKQLQEFSNLFVGTQNKQKYMQKWWWWYLTSQKEKERDPHTKYWAKVIGGIQKDQGTWAYHEPSTFF
jgi:hypothetical protein